MESYFLRGGTTTTSLPRTAHEQFRPISVCIMDEASQCVEPEALIPLKLGFTKVIVK
jgi:superfamily I DNA and/or RNA helicase